MKKLLLTKVSEEKFRFKACIIILSMLFALTCFLLCAEGSAESDEYPLKNSFLQQEQYKLQFAAFLDGHIALDAVPSEMLSEIDNPYDPDVREEANLHPYYRELENSYLWDTAYYNGQYFSYFGIAPILTVYYPYYVLTGSIPSHVTVCLILAVLASFFLMLAYREAILAFCRDANFLLSIIGAICLFFCSGIPLAISYADNYYLAVISGVCFSMASVFSGLYAVRKTKKHAKCVFFAMCAVSLTLTVWSRPSAAFMCLILVPSLFTELKFSLEKLKETGKVKELLPIALFAFTVTCGAICVMIYNYVRFDSPFEFGARYQLTVNDISRNTLTLSLLAESVYAYFLQNPEFSDGFNLLFKPSVRLFTSTDRFIYCTDNIGCLWYGLPLGVSFAFSKSRFKQNRTAFFSGITAVLVALLMGFVNFCVGGVNMRYTLDVLPMLSLLGVVLLLGHVSFSTGRKKTAACVIFALTCCLSILGSFGWLFFSKGLL